MTLKLKQRSSLASAPEGDSQVVSGERVRTPEHLLSALLDLGCRLPLQAGVRAVTEAFVDGLAEIAGGAAVGVCVVVDPEQEPLVLRRVPTEATEITGRDPARLFPESKDERIIQLRDGYGSTLHVASSSAPLDPTLMALAERAATQLCASLSHSRAFDSPREPLEQIDSLRAQVIQAEKLASLGQIVAGFVHELNNPLTSIIAYTDYLKRRSQQRQGTDADVEDELERLRRIGEAAERILKFSRDLVAYARPSRSVPAPVPIDEVIDKALLFCEHEFLQSNVSITQPELKGLPAVRGNRGQLTQIFVNLFTNAAHAMRGRGGRGGKLELRAEAQPGQLLIEVADDGVGISAEDLTQIFEPFFTTKSDGQGSGLGLSIVRDIVQSHGGQLRAVSTPGVGSVFRVYLPLSAMPSARPGSGSTL